MSDFIIKKEWFINSNKEAISTYYTYNEKNVL